MLRKRVFGADDIALDILGIAEQVILETQLEIAQRRHPGEP
jgi:hypothetical protein